MRVTSPAIEIKDIWDALTAAYGAAGTYGLLIETNLDGKVSDTKAVVDANKVLIDLNLDSKVSLAKADLTTLETRLSAARATALDELLAGNIPTDLSGLATAVGLIPTTMVGTNSAALASAWTAALATILGNFSAARIGYLDNIDASIKELFYEHFAFTVDDLPDIAVSGDATGPANLYDNDTALTVNFSAVGKYVEINLGSVCYIKRVRHFGIASSDGDSRYRLQAYVAGVWEDCLTEIVDRDAASWSSWLNLTTPRTAMRWRWECTTRGASALIGEVELDGVCIG